MNITILANRDIASNVALNYLVDHLSHHQLTIFLSDQVGARQPLPQALTDLKFFEQTLFNDIVFPAIDHQSITASRYHTFQQLGRIIGRPVETLNDINLASGHEKLVASNPELILSIRFGKILKAPALSVPQHGVINLHSGLLPQYQGVMATFWAMFHGETEYGTTLHFIDSAAIDAGPIIQRSAHPLDLNQSYFTNVLALYQQGCENMLAAVAQIAAGQKPELEPQSSEARYFTFPDERQLQTFFAQGLRLCDSQHVMQLVKAYQGLE